jgi:hypothetical protein
MRENFENAVAATYRVVYLRPNRYSDEALVIGVVVEAAGRTCLRVVQSEGALEALAYLFGETGKEQTIHALALLHGQVGSGAPRIDDLRTPSDLLFLGDTKEGHCSDPQQFAHDLLEISSSLFRSYHSPTVPSRYVTQEEVALSLFNSVTELNALKASGLFQETRVPISTNTTIKVPICGDRVVGGPVSFVTKQVGAAKTQAEALIAKYSLVGRKLRRQPALYVLTPTSDSRVNQREVDNSLFELHAVADGHGVWLRHERRLSELAHVLLRDDAA